ncbi:MAG: hypothetical protein KGZ87_04770 [Bacteroidetes bacterium]|nr:hypothetical protein [Bacteroidota bacterium]
MGGTLVVLSWNVIDGTIKPVQDPQEKKGEQSLLQSFSCGGCVAICSVLWAG